MDTIHLPEAGRSRRRYTSEFKAQIIAACQQPGVSTTGIALANQINPNVVRRWIRNHQLTQVASIPVDVACADAPAQRTPRVSALVPVEVAIPVPRSDRAIQSGGAGADKPHVSRAPNASRVPHSMAPPIEPIRLELRRGDTLLNVAWPAIQAESCALWLRELLQ
jgi:transposase-like protein